MRHGLMAGGRPTRFAPKKVVSREAPEPEGERENSQEIRMFGASAAALQDSIAFERVMEQLFLEAEDKFLESPLGSDGDIQRSGARYMIAALSQIQARIARMAEDAEIQEREDAAREAAPTDA